MSIRSLMSAAHAAGYALAVTEVSFEDDAEAAQVAAAGRVLVGSDSRALAVRVPEADRTNSMREWLQGFRARVTA